MTAREISRTDLAFAYDHDHFAYFCQWCGWSENEGAEYQPPSKGLGGHDCNEFRQRRKHGALRLVTSTETIARR